MNVSERELRVGPIKFPQETHLFSFAFLRNLDAPIIALLDDASNLPSFLDGNECKDARFIANQNARHILPVHIATLSTPDACGSLEGHGRLSLANVHIEYRSGAGELSFKCELRLEVALGVCSVNRRRD